MLDYGQSLRYHRECAGLNQSELARAIGTSHQNINRWESNKILPNIDFCVRLADYYGISIDELIGRDSTYTK